MHATSSMPTGTSLSFVGMSKEVMYSAVPPPDGSGETEGFIFIMRAR